jgi:penicillin amidase
MHSLQSSQYAAIFETFVTSFQKNVLLDEMGEELYREFLSAFLLPSYAVDNIWRKKESPWCDDVTTKDREETFTDMAQKSFKETVAALAGELGNDPGDWQWGKAHKLHIDHPMGQVGLLDRLFKFNRGPFAVGGSHHHTRKPALLRPGRDVHRQRIPHRLHEQGSYREECKV